MQQLQAKDVYVFDLLVDAVNKHKLPPPSKCFSLQMYSHIHLENKGHFVVSTI